MLVIPFGLRICPTLGREVPRAWFTRDELGWNFPLPRL
jgi:hypothetical protein